MHAQLRRRTATPVVREFGAIEGGKQTLARLAEQLAEAPLVLERTFDAPADFVWKALTDLEQMKQWYFDTLPAFKPEVGFETQFNVRHNDKDYPHIWKVTEVVAGKKITYSWKYGGSPGESFVYFELFAEGDQTRLKLTHSGLETFLRRKPITRLRAEVFRRVVGPILWTFRITEPTCCEKHSPPSDRDFVISREFAAPRELVWQAWNDPKHMAQWWGPHQFTNPVCELDVRVGGAYRIVMRGPDGVEYPMSRACLQSKRSSPSAW